MPGLVPGTHVFLAVIAARIQDVDGRDKPGQSGFYGVPTMSSNALVSTPFGETQSYVHRVLSRTTQYRQTLRGRYVASMKMQGAQ